MLVRPDFLSNLPVNTVALRRLQANEQQQEKQPEQEQEDLSTGDYLAGALQKMAQRQAPPQLDPGSRVKFADTSLTEPSNFQGYYDNLGYINQIGQNMLAAEQQRAAYRRQQQLNSISNQSVQSSGGGSQQGAVGYLPSNPKANFGFAQKIAGNYGWNNPNELGAWYALGMKESGWNNNAQNPTSTAYGIGQFLNSTWAGYGIAKTSDPALQVEAMARYIKARYGSPSRALAFHNSHNWY